MNKLQLALSRLVSLFNQIALKSLKLPLFPLHQNLLRSLEFDSHYFLFLRETLHHFVANVEDDLASVSLLDVHKNETLLVCHYRSESKKTYIGTCRSLLIWTILHTSPRSPSISLPGSKLQPGEMKLVW